jgi:type IV secretion system protein VirD4
MSATVDQIERPLVTPDEVMRLRPPTKSGHGTAERIVSPGDMLIFVSGHYPIYGTQILYFTDSVLAERAAIPPPTECLAIEEGRAVRQRPADRTRNVISAAEPRHQATAASPVPETPMSPMEEAFWRKMGERPSDSPRSPASTGFIEQLDLDFHEAEVHQDHEKGVEDNAAKKPN